MTCIISFFSIFANLKSKPQHDSNQQDNKDRPYLRLP